MVSSARQRPPPIRMGDADVTHATHDSQARDEFIHNSHMAHAHALAPPHTARHGNITHASLTREVGSTYWRTDLNRPWNWSLVLMVSAGGRAVG
jgi:hypothetical protein